MLTQLEHPRFDAGDVVPPCYERYRPLVRDAVAFFVERLSPRRAADAMAAQLALPVDAPAGLRLVTLMHQCPALHKLGQVLARHPQLDAAFRGQLQQLESREPATPLAEVEPVIRRELGDAIASYRITLGDAPLAEASVAVVVPFTWVDPDDADQLQREGVFKVLRPGVAARMTEDLAILAALADHLDATFAVRGLPPLPYRRTLEDVAALLRNEIDLRIEQRHLAAAQRIARWHAGVVVPRLCPFQSPHVTAMQRVHGVCVTDAADHRRSLAARIARALLAEVVFNDDDLTLFHADPHAGNLFATDDGDLAVLDWSLTGWLTRDDRAAMLQLTLAAAVGDPEGTAAGLAALAGADHEPAALSDVVAAYLASRGDRPLQLPSVMDVIRLVDHAVQRGISFPARFLLLRKSVFTLEGVVADLTPDTPLDHWLTAAALQQVLVSEAAIRLCLPPTSRRTPSGLSLLDLGRLAAGWSCLAFGQLCCPSRAA